MKAQSEIIENLSHQVSSAAKGNEDTEKFKQMFEKVAKHSRFMHNVSKQLNNTVKNVQELAGEWSKSTAKIIKQLKGLKKENHENEEDKKHIEEKLMEKIEKLQEEMKILQVSQNSANSEWTACKEGESNEFKDRFYLYRRASATDTTSTAAATTMPESNDIIG